MELLPVSDLVSDFLANSPCLAKPALPKLVDSKGFCARQVSGRLSPLGDTFQSLAKNRKALLFRTIRISIVGA
jgi:hypothetical protein